MSLSISRVLQQYNMTSCITSRKPRISPKQRRVRVDCCNEHLSWSAQDWSKVKFSDQGNYQVLNRKNRIYFRRFRTDWTRFERSQGRTHRGGGLCICTTHHCALEAQKWSIYECFLETGEEFFVRTNKGVENFGSPDIFQKQRLFEGFTLERGVFPLHVAHPREKLWCNSWDKEIKE